MRKRSVYQRAAHRDPVTLRAGAYGEAINLDGRLMRGYVAADEKFHELKRDGTPGEAYEDSELRAFAEPLPPAGADAAWDPEPNAPFLIDRSGSRWTAVTPDHLPGPDYELDRLRPRAAHYWQGWAIDGTRFYMTWEDMRHHGVFVPADSPVTTKLEDDYSRTVSGLPADKLYSEQERAEQREGYHPDLDIRNRYSEQNRADLIRLVRENGAPDASDEEIERGYDFGAILSECGIHFCGGGYGLQVDLDVDRKKVIERGRRNPLPEA